MGPSRPNPSGGWGLRAISLSFVVNDASASPPPLFAISPRKTHPQTSSYLWKGVLKYGGLRHGGLAGGTLTDPAAGDGASKITIEFKPQGKKTRVPSGMSIFNAANWIGLPIDSTCGGRGTCGKCKVRVVKGDAATSGADREFFSEPELSEGWRLSCRARADHDLICEVPALAGNPQAALMGMDRQVTLEPNVHKIALQLQEPSLEDQRSDYTRIRDALVEEGFEVHTSVHLLRRLPALLRRADWSVTAVVAGQELVDVEAGDTRERCYGLALDIGTTTVVGILVDLTSGAVAAAHSSLNKQYVHGADVISRISHAMLEEDGIAQLNRNIVETLDDLVEQLLGEATVDPSEVYEVVAAGNATMLHLLLGLDPEPIGVTPFIPTAQDLLQISAREIPLAIHPQAQVRLLPHLGAYVGADLMGGLLATGLAQKDGMRLLVDVGTNGEIILGSAARTIATAAPAGPAFEGAQIRDGMRASQGAIETVRIIEDSVQLQVIGDVPPVGLCGSGLIDAVAELRLAGLLDPSGKFVVAREEADRAFSALSRRFTQESDGSRAFVLAWPEETGTDRPVVLTQRDIRELQFAKAAIAGGIQVLMEELGVGAEDLEEIYLAGSFGTYINPRNARIIGLVPPVSVERIKAVGNAAGEGAKMALVSFRERQVARALPRIIEYHELSGRADFSDSFISILKFPELDELAPAP